MDTTYYNQSYTYNHISNILNYNANLLIFIKYISLLIILFIYYTFIYITTAVLDYH